MKVYYRIRDICIINVSDAVKTELRTVSAYITVFSSLSVAHAEKRLLWVSQTMSQSCVVSTSNVIDGIWPNSRLLGLP